MVEGVILMSEFLESLVKDLADENTTLAVDGKSSAEFSSFIDTGSYVLNAVLSGSLYGGVPNNKVTAFAGETSTGKTFFVLSVIAQFLKDHEEGGVIYFDTESAVTNEMLQVRNIPLHSLVKSEPDTIEKFRHTALQIIDRYLEQDPEERRPMLMVLDSLGQLSSTKEIVDTAEGKETRDMTKAQVLKAAFRVLSLKLAKAGIPLIVTNHVYAVIGSYFSQNEMSGGSGLKYSASLIALLSKRKERVDKEIIGNFIKVKMEKSRISRENKEVEVLLRYETGLDRYYGLVDLGVEAGIFKKAGNRIQLPSGSKVYEKVMLTTPSEYFTPDIMDQIEEYAQTEFKYGMWGESEEEMVEEPTEEPTE